MSDPRQFVKIYNPKSGNYMTVNTMKDAAETIAKMSPENQGTAIWYSIKEAFKVGQRVGSKHAWEEAERRYGVKNPYRSNP